MPATVQPSTVIELRDAAVANSHAPGRVAVENVNWFIYDGDYWVVSGLPGAGKSDLLATAAGLLKPLRGSHRLFGRDTFELTPDELARERLRVGVVFANEGRLFQHLTVAENIALPLAYHQNQPMSRTAEAVAAVLELTDLGEVAHDRPSRLNPSLRQRAALARALILRPEVLLIDEPLRGLDPGQTRWWLEFLSRLHAGHEFLEGRKTTLIVATNDLGVWIRQAEKFALINERRWMFLGSRDELKSRREPLLQELLTPEFAGL